MVEPVSLVLGSLLVCCTNITIGGVIETIAGGVVGNEAHRLFQGAVRRVSRAVSGDSPERANHDIMRTVRLAHLAALEQALDGFERASDTNPPTLFLEAAAKFCREQRRSARTNPESLVLQVTETLTAVVDGRLDGAPVASPAGQRAQAIASFAEDEVLAELHRRVGGVPAAFENYLRTGTPRFLDAFADEIREAVKSNPRFRDIVVVSGLAEIKAQGFDIAASLDDLTKQLGMDRATLLGALGQIDEGVKTTQATLERMAAEADRRHAEQLAKAEAFQAEMRQMQEDAKHGGPQAAEALRRFRAMLAKNNPDIDKVPDEKLPDLLQAYIAELAKPGIDPQTLLTETARKAVTEAEALRQAGDPAGARQTLNQAIAKAETPARDTASMLAARARAARQQLLYRDEANDLSAASGTVQPFDRHLAWEYATDAADALMRQGDEFGDNAALADSIARLRAALSLAPCDQAAADWSWTYDKLGTVTRLLGEREADPARLLAAVEAFDMALLERTRDRDPQAWADTQSRRASVLVRLGERENGTARLEQAIAAFRDVLLVQPRQSAPQSWAGTQNNLGIALSTLGQRETGTTRLERAVDAYRAALLELTRDRVPLDWATTQNNLGIALSALGERESGTTRLEQAVDAYRAALLEYTRDRVPLQWAMTQNNLGAALRTLGERESGTTRLEQAVDAYRAALLEYTRDRVPLNWAITQNNLGTALQTLGERESGTTRLEQAVDAYRAALLERTRDRVPLDWATTQNNLGSALRRLGERESGTTRLEQAVDAYRTALLENTRDRAPLGWVNSQYGYANALATLATRTKSRDQLREAITRMRDAADVFREGNAYAFPIAQQAIAAMEAYLATMPP